MKVAVLFRLYVGAQLLAFAVAGGSPFGAAQARAAGVMPDFGTIDTDSDKRLDRRELGVAASLDFERLDVEHHGYLTRAEFAKTRSAKLLLPFPGRVGTTAAFTAADTNRDGTVDKREYTRAVVRAYLGCDRERAGTIGIDDLRHCRM
jgi:hypothetical protein